MKKLYLRIFFTIMAIGIAFPLQAQNWTMTGNNATTSHFLGTKNENPLTFKTNRHLPEIPSEQEVLENGLDVAEMNALLLKKVEELTLYIIELEKRITEIEKKGGER